VRRVRPECGDRAAGAGNNRVAAEAGALKSALDDLARLSRQRPAETIAAVELMTTRRRIAINISAVAININTVIG
jgi:hypothetical protein